jgi:TPR repeat protein
MKVVRVASPSKDRDAAGWRVGIDMRAVAYANLAVERASFRRRFAFAIIGTMTLGFGPALAFDGSTSDPSEKIPKNFSDPKQALQAGIIDLKAGDADASVRALTYAADSGETIARWKLGEMYADGQGVRQDDLKAYHYFNQLVEDYDEDQPDRRNLSAISNAFVAVGVYCLNGIPNSEVRPDAERAHELFQYAATIFGNPNAQYNLAHMYMVGAGGLAKDNIAAIRWLAMAAGKGHAPSEALLGHMLFMGDGVPHQRARGLMWLAFAKEAAPAPSDTWISDLYQHDLQSASDGDRQAAATLHDARAKQALPSTPVRDVVKFILKPLQFGPLAGAPAAPQ